MGIRKHCGREPISIPFGEGWIVGCRSKRCPERITGADEESTITEWNELQKIPSIKENCDTCKKGIDEIPQSKGSVLKKVSKGDYNYDYWKYYRRIR